MSQPIGAELSVGGAAVPPAAASADGLEDSDVLNDVFIESTWRGRAVRFDREQQFDGVATKEVASQAKELMTSGAQTDSAAGLELKADAPLPPAFANFLNKAYPTLAAQLEANLESRAFDDYLVAWDEERDAFENVFQLQHAAAIAELDQGSQPQQQQSSSSSKRGAGSRFMAPPRETEHGGVLGVSWSCNGSVLVASYGSSSHVGWCNHGAATLSFWNIMRRQISSTRPDFTLEQGCCCMCVAYHPERPTILAGGMFNGEVRVWDTALLDDAISDETTGEAGALPAERNPLLMRSGIDDHFHREPVSRVEWVRDPATRAWQLVSVSADGKVLFWPMDDPTNKLQWPTDGYLLQPGDKYAGQRLAGAPPSRNKFAVLGGTAIAFAQSQASSASEASADAAGGAAVASPGSSTSSPYFVVATEGGGVLRVALSNILKRKGFLKSGEARWSRDAYRLIEQSSPASKFELKKFIEKYAKSTSAEAIDLACVFAARPDPLQLYPPATDLSFDGHAGPVYGLAFNRFEKTIFATASTDGRVKVFHVNSTRPLLTLDPGSEYLFGLVWSPSRPLVFAVCDGSGRVIIYDLLSSLLSPALIIPPAVGAGPSQALAWNVAEPSLLACADMRGRISVWNLSAKYAQVQPGEKRMIEQMAHLKEGT